ncbi:MAG: hypothetical protein HOP12_06180 [Candidatus Eisenbacteria bacterium]|uniref:Nuclear transport factor 2 family protein n=1 Tax=Eiseniibacteriota bacterium TaxID=2212470 RepID=A0A849SJC0_UNCEI|nr:hypothetical protein [Candidatus Eisenbacteria bacterium]
MKRSLRLLTLLCACILMRREAAAADATTAAAELAKAEQGFAKLSVDTHMKTAFTTWLAGHSILFKPGPVDGQKFYRDRPEPKGVLDWAPAFVEVSGDGQFGFSTGPWTYQRARDQSPIAFGRFVSIWKREGAGEWRVLLDTGISHADPGRSLRSGEPLEFGPLHAAPDTNAWKPRPLSAGVAGQVGGKDGTIGGSVGTGGMGVSVGTGGFGVGVSTGSQGVRSKLDYQWRRNAHDKHTLLSAERTFTWNARSRSWDRAYRAVGANDVRLLRDGAFATTGLDTAIARMTSRPRNRDWFHRGEGMSGSWDLGYTYGLAVAHPKGARSDTTAYVHLWRKDEAGNWKLMLDVESEFPKP